MHDLKKQKIEWEKTKEKIRKLKEEIKTKKIQGKIKDALLLKKYEKKIKDLKEKLKVFV
ncbi:hypothetical protein [endosymbiont GvMRE of Glomus versiforme]|uniref:hypothetical protein n=1 Tax=endosymbiont GvMRE of Glomus versiforme TaxID=2039283 RepID=UPI000ED5690B|nr:hypothetical protein [endosymbiont GvMRE of Glomus versiforme]RHZ36066.1 hypothetical protein GvMRE_Ic3g145 [endosymbiont GvMRE of Glomus versiforme]